MNALLLQLLKLKPEFLPRWLFVLLLTAGVLIVACVAAVGVWVVFTQVEFL